MGNVLIVDDEYIAINGIKNYINWKRCNVDQVFTAMSVKKAKEIIQSERIDLMLTDIEMPGDSGINLLKWVNEYYSDMVCIILSSHADFSYAKDAIRFNAFLYLLKPSPLTEMEEAVAEGIDEAKRRKILAKIEQSVEKQFDDTDEKKALEKAKRYIADHLDEEISRKTVADTVYLNQDYLSRLFKKETGLTFNEYIVAARISRAKMLLLETRKNVQEIAGMTGFNSASYFAKIFKQETGMTPAAFRMNGFSE